jgi:His-Xaa-Ser system radical SAM maturase HxsB
MPYQLFPFKFQRFNNNEVLMSNEVGEFLFVSNDEFAKMISYKLDSQSQIFLNLKAKHILSDTEIKPVIKMLATKYRTKKSFLYSFTSLHMIVVTLRCNAACNYCQVSQKDKDNKGYDLNIQTAKEIVDLIFQSPSLIIKIEFQGGEPLLNFKVVKYIIKYAKKLNKKYKKQLEFVLCTNLTLATNSILRFLKKYKIYISTTLDGPRWLHNKHRILQDGQGSYDIVVDKINRARKLFGNEGVDALMTITKDSLEHIPSIIDEYVNRGFHGIFLRALNPYGFAKKREGELGYNVKEFVQAYKRGLQYIIELNIKGTFFMEYYTSLLLSRILTPFSTSFVDLQSPAGVGIQGVIYNYNGNVYVSDEGRMLAAMGDNRFLMGNAHKNTYKELFYSDMLKGIIKNSCLECLPMCADCVFQSYCGADPVRNYSEQGDIIGHRPTSKVCKNNREIISYLFELIKTNDPKILDVFWSWITTKPIEEIQV